MVPITISYLLSRWCYNEIGIIKEGRPPNRKSAEVEVEKMEIVLANTLANISIIVY